MNTEYHNLIKLYYELRTTSTTPQEKINTLSAYIHEHAGKLASDLSLHRNHVELYQKITAALGPTIPPHLLKDIQSIREQANAHFINENQIPLKNLNLSVEELTRIAPQLTYVDCRDIKFKNAYEAVNFIKSCTNATQFFINTDKIEYLKDLPQTLQTLDCSNCHALRTVNCAKHPNLMTLNVSNCKSLGMLDNSECMNLSELNVTNCQAFMTHICNKCTNLKTINISNCQILSFNCEDCKNLKELTFINCRGLQKLNCSRCQSLKELNLSNFGQLQLLDCFDCNNLNSLDLSNCSALRKLSCSYCSNLSVLTTTNCQSLQELDFHRSGVKILNLINCTALETLYISHSALTELTLSNCQTLQKLEIPNCNHLKLLNVSNCNALQEITCTNNPITKLTLGNCRALKILRCFQCPSLPEINLSNCLALEELHCSNSSIRRLTLLDCSALKKLSCFQCPSLTELNLSGCLALQTLDCSACPITELNLSNCRLIEILTCSECSLLERIITTSLPNFTRFDYGGCPRLRQLPQIPARTQVFSYGSFNFSSFEVVPEDLISNPLQVLCHLGELIFKNKRMPNIVYLNSPGLDAGGLRRQLVTSLMQNLFEKENSPLNLLPREAGIEGTMPLLAENDQQQLLAFKTIGALIALAALTSMPLGRFLRPELFVALLYLEAEDLTTFDENLENKIQSLVAYGVPNAEIESSGQPIALPIAWMAKGFREIANPEEFRNNANNFILRVEGSQVTWDNFDRLTTYTGPNAEQIKEYFKTFFERNPHKLNDMVELFTASRALGEEKIKIIIDHNLSQGNLFEMTTCFQQVKIPPYTTYALFEEKLLKSIEHSLGQFGKA